jgi:hypothetical protein
VGGPAPDPAVLKEWFDVSKTKLQNLFGTDLQNIDFRNPFPQLQRAAEVRKSHLAAAEKPTGESDVGVSNTAQAPTEQSHITKP